jgi:hypothetical protein
LAHPALERLKTPALRERSVPSTLLTEPELRRLLALSRHHRPRILYSWVTSILFVCGRVTVMAE